MVRYLRTVVICFGLLGVGLHSSDAHAEGEAAPTFSLRDINGKQVDLANFKDKVVLINFWATWCQPCQIEMVHLEQMYKELGPKGFVVLSISIDENRSKSMVKPLVKSKGFTFPVLLDTDTAVVAQYNPSKVLPYSAVLDRSHKIRFVHQGYNPGDEVALKAEIESLLAAPQ